MSLKNTRTLEDKRVELEIGIPGSEFSEEVTKVFRKEAAKMTVPGFRKGKAPRSIIEKMYGKSVFYEEALNSLLPAAVDAAVAEAGIAPVSRADVDVKTTEPGGVLFTATFYVRPEASVKDYKGIAIEKEITKVSEAEAERALEDERRKNARRLTVIDRPAQTGDYAVLDYSGSVDGVKFEGGTAEKYRLQLGSGRFIPGFEGQVAGKSVGEEFDVNVTFPEDYNSKALAGKKAVFKCLLHEIEHDELPELDDEFAKDISEFNTLAEYKADVRAKLEKQAANSDEAEADGKLIDGIIAGLEADIPQVMFDSELEVQLDDYANRLASHGVDLRTFMSYTGDTDAKLRERFAPAAERQVKLRLALEAIARQENITASEEEVAAKYAEMSQMYDVTEEELRSRIGEKSVREDIAVQKAFDLVKANAKVTEKEREEKPANGEK